MGTSASTRWSTAAVASWMAPPYEPPIIPTRGSPFASSVTKSALVPSSAARVPARKSISPDAAWPSMPGSSSETRQPDLPKPSPE